MKTLSFFVVILILFLSVSLITNAQITNQQKIQNVIDSTRLQYGRAVNKICPSLSILIHTPADYIFASSSSNLNEYNVTLNTHFRFASNTKNFTSASILNMQEDGWLNIKDKIISNIRESSTPYVPNTPEFAIPFKDEITIEQLLQHSAGVYDVDNDPVPGFEGYSYTDYMDFNYPARQIELSELVNQAAKNNLSYFPPGKGYHYSNTGYTILSIIIERIYSLKSGSPKKYADYINDYISGSTAPSPVNVAFPYIASVVSLPFPDVRGVLWAPDSTAIFTKVNMSSHVGEGNGYGTFAELDKYIRAIMKGQSVLNANSIELMKKTVSDSNKTYALGCFYIEDLGYGHNGCIKGYLSYMMYDPLTDVSVIIMMNANDYTMPEEKGIAEGLKALVNGAFASRMALGFSGRIIPY